MYLIDTSKIQSQSKLLGHFTVILLSQCWCSRFGELSAINNIRWTRRWTTSKKFSVQWKCPNYFCLRLQLLNTVDTSKLQLQPANSAFTAAGTEFPVPLVGKLYFPTLPQPHTIQRSLAVHGVLDVSHCIVVINREFLLNNSTFVLKKNASSQVKKLLQQLFILGYILTICLFLLRPVLAGSSLNLSTFDLTDKTIHSVLTNKMKKNLAKCYENLF